MGAAVLLRRAGALGLASTLGVLGVSAGPASAEQSALPAPTPSAKAAVTAGLAGQPGRVDWSNVGAPHSPQLLRQLAGPAAGSGRSGPAVINGAIAGAAQGVDVASFQHPNGDPISWTQVAAAGIQFAAVKATEGTYYQNPFALTDLAAAQAAGLSVVAYAFAIPNGKGAVAQADYLLSYLGADSRTVPIMLDIEYDPNVNKDHTNQCYGLTQAAMVSWIAAFDTEIHRKTGRLPVIYAPPSWWGTCTGGSTEFSQIPLWVPAYTSAGSPTMPAGWSNWSIWQYTSSGTVSGIETTGHTDLDQLNPGVVALLNPGHQHGVAGSPVDWRLKLAVPVPGQVPSFSASGLPAGVSVSARGRVTGWPDRPGIYRVRVTATDSHGAAGSVSFSWRVKRAPDRGPTGLVRLHKAGKCLHDAGNRSASGTPVNIWRCNGSAAERWTAVQDDTLRIHGKCLAAPGMASGARAELRSCSGSGAQHWLVGSRGRLINPGSGLCLADPGGSTRNGTRVRLRVCTGHAAQQWTLPAGPVASQLPGRCLDDLGNGRTSGNPVDLAACNGSAAQTWRARPDGTLRIHSKCLAVSRSGAVSGTPVDLRTCTGGRVQWRMVADRGGVSLVNPASGLCLADPGDARASGTRLAVLTCSASDPGMAWRVH
jgi:GH25 family lysozyme M1 (1,4-beta-N-acetylmuramidase)